MSSAHGGSGSTKPPPFLVKATAPIAVRLAGRRWFPLWAQVHHRGRRSGKDYVIPVAVLATPESFVIGLPWGAKTNWVRNVLAAGGCTMRWKGTDYRVIDPHLVGADVALAATRGVKRAMLKRGSFPAFLQVTR
jgi:deazaflavin-dependent oxidoreductase (nitroreductase family)